MNVFYIVRHGETENNRAGRLSGWIDTALTDTGLLPLEKVIPKVKNARINALYSSDMGRAFITAYVVAGELNFAKEIQRLPGLREVNYGDAANMLRAEAYAQYPGIDSDTQFTPPNGESLAHMQQRVLKTIGKFDAAHSDSNILLVCHSGTMAALNASFKGQDFGEHNISEAYPHDFVGKFTFENDSVKSFEEVLG